MPVSYKRTIYACYMGNITQAAVVNLTPVLFIPLRELYGISYTAFGLLVLVNFVTQVACDVLFSGAVDRYGFRRFILAAPLLAALGFVVFLLAPQMFPANPMIGFVAGTILFSGSGGLMELLLSPIVNAIPTDEKAAAMSVLHSFYSWGQVFVVLVTTLLVLALGRQRWQLILALWIALPLVCFFLFLRAPLAPSVPEDKRESVRSILGKVFFWAALLAIVFGGAAELVMAQWASPFIERALAVDKVLGDTLGLCLFAAMMGIGRLASAKLKIPVLKIMAAGSCLAIVCYIVAALSPIPAISVAACALCGLGVSLLWPGTIVATADHFPLAGAWIFAIMAAGGDIGASIGPAVTGFIADHAANLPFIAQIAANAGMTGEAAGLRAGLLSGAVFPLGTLFCALWMMRLKKRQEIVRLKG